MIVTPLIWKLPAPLVVIAVLSPEALELPIPTLTLVTPMPLELVMVPVPALKVAVRRFMTEAKLLVSELEPTTRLVVPAAVDSTSLLALAPVPRAAVTVPLVAVEMALKASLSRADHCARPSR